jgi:hypothetical protein
LFDRFRTTKYTARAEPDPVFLVVEATAAEQTHRLIVDTGSSHLVLFDTSGGGTETRPAASLLGVTPVRPILLRSLRVGNWTRREVKAVTVRASAAAQRTHGVLGIASLGCTYVHFDFAKQTVGWND